MRLRLRDTVEAQILPSHLRVISYIWTPQRIWNLEIEVLGAPELHIKIQEGTSFCVEDLTSRRGNQVDWVIHWAQVLKERLLDHIPLSKGNVCFFFFSKKGPLADKTLFFCISGMRLICYVVFKKLWASFVVLQRLHSQTFWWKKKEGKGYVKGPVLDSRDWSSSHWSVSKAYTRGCAFPPYNNSSLGKEQQACNEWVNFLFVTEAIRLLHLGLFWLDNGLLFYSLKCSVLCKGQLWYLTSQHSLPCGR